MLEKIINFTLNQKNLIVFLCIAIIIFGIFSFTRLPIDAFPDVTNVQVEIVSTTPGLSALEIERFVTQPIEIAMRGIPGLVELRSVTKFGISVITVVLKDNVDIYFARQQVFERLSEAEKKVPSGVEISMGPIATAMGEIYQFTLQGNEPSDSLENIKYLTDLRTIQEWIITPLLKNIPGVSEINSFGGYFKQYQVIVQPERLLKYNLTLQDIFKSIDENNKNTGGNIIDSYSEQYIVRGVGLLRSNDDIEKIVLKSQDGTPVFLKDVAEVKIGESVRQGAALMNGEKEIVGGIVLMLRGENSKAVVSDVEQKVKEINEGNILPKGMKIVPYYDRSEIINKSISTVSKALIEGSILVLIILYLLLKNIRGAFVVIFSLPLTLLITFILMKYFNFSANLMSLGGLAISIGMIIDATIIQVENVQRHLSQSENKDKSVLKAVLEVRKPSIFGEMIIAVTFLPILFLEGIEGKMFAPLAITVAIALFSSLILSIFITPSLCSISLLQHAEKKNAIMERLKKMYFPVLYFCLRKKLLVYIVSTIFIIAAFLIFPFLGTEFIPIMDEGAFDFDVQLMPGVTLSKSLEVNKLISKKLKQFDELETAVSRTGRTGIALEARGVDKSGYVGILKPKSEWKNASDRDELFNKMRESLSSIPGISFGFSQPIQCRIDELIAGTRAQLIVKLFGENYDILKEKSSQIAEIISKIEGTKDLVIEKTTGQSYLSIIIDRNKIARYSLNISDVLNVVEIAVGGKNATQLYEENKSFDVIVRYPEKDRSSVQTIGNTLIPTKFGYNIPLSELAEIETTEGPTQISRENGMRRIGIELNISGRDIGGYVKEAKMEIGKKVDLPIGYRIEWGGQFENQERAMNKLMIITPIALGLIMLLLFITFKSIKQTLLVMFILPFALVGGVFALFISGIYLSVPASIGFIVLFGVAVLNGIVLVSYISQLQNSGMSINEAVIKGCEDRFRPVLMTALISIFSLIPMLFATGPGSEIQKPLAIVVIGGLFTSTFLTLCVIPMFYEWMESNKFLKNFLN